MAQQAVTKRQHIRKSRGDLAFYITINAILAILSLIIFYPLLYIRGASREDDKLMVSNDSCTLGSLSMTSYLFEAQG